MNRLILDRLGEIDYAYKICRRLSGIFRIENLTILMQRIVGEFRY